MHKFGRQFYYVFKIVNTMLINKTWHLPVRYKQAVPALGFISFFYKKENDSKKQCLKIIEKADTLFNNEEYYEVYHLLNEYKYEKNVEILWRICRALYKMSRLDEYDVETKKDMINEAYDIINETELLDANNSNIHKWLAIILDTKLQHEKKIYNIRENLKIRDHLLKAYALNSEDFTVLYMLGHWYYTICTLSWLQQKYLEFFTPDSPKCNYDKALNYLLQAEKLKPRYYLSNTYLLGRINYLLGNVYRANYYLNMAVQMTPTSNKEEDYVRSARYLLKKLKMYEVKDDAL